MTEVSVIIPTFNRGQKVVRAVASVLYQTFRNLEIIVVDDGSQDDTQQRLRSFRDKIVSLVHPQNMGVSAARNTGIRASRSPLIAFLDSDDYWLPEKIEKQTTFFRQHPDAVACQTEEHWVRHGRRVNPRNKHRKPSGDIFGPSLKLCLVSPSAVMLKRALLSEVGFFDESLPACEDYDLWLRIASRYPVHLIQEYLLVKEGGHKDQLSTTIKGLDRFRIRSLEKLILAGGLQRGQLEAALRELAEKCRIYGTGCLKRGKDQEAAYYLDLPRSIALRIQGVEDPRGQGSDPGQNKAK